VIAADTSAWIAYLSGQDGVDVEAMDQALADSQVCLPPVVLTELLSEPSLPGPVADALLQIPVLEVTEGYWQRAGILRSRVLAGRRKARLADTLIAQSCIDHDLALLAREQDYRSFVRVADLKLLR